MSRRGSERSINGLATRAGTLSLNYPSPGRWFLRHCMSRERNCLSEATLQSSSQLDRSGRAVTWTLTVRSWDTSRALAGASYPTFQTTSS
jgi:hypothetical protein